MRILSIHRAAKTVTLISAVAAALVATAGAAPRVWLESFNGNRWRPFGRAVQTSSTGLARWSVRFPRGRYVVRARFAGTIDLAAATSSGVSIRVR